MSKDPEMKTYYCAEIDPKGKVMDYEAHNYRKFDFNWNFKDLKLGNFRRQRFLPCGREHFVEDAKKIRVDFSGR